MTAFYMFRLMSMTFYGHVPRTVLDAGASDTDMRRTVTAMPGTARTSRPPR